MGEERRDFHRLGKALDPAKGFLLFNWPVRVFALGRLRSITLQLHQAQWQPLLAQRQRTMQAQPAAFRSGLVGPNLAQAFTVTAGREIQIGGVLHDQGDPLIFHPANRLVPMALEQVLPIEFRPFVIEKAIVRFELMPLAAAGLSIGSLGLGCLG